VVYGDTDSMFVCLAGRAREQVGASSARYISIAKTLKHTQHTATQALRDARALAARVTELNPSGVLLKVRPRMNGKGG
jgi:hypothetical protein